MRHEEKDNVKREGSKCNVTQVLQLFCYDPSVKSLIRRLFSMKTRQNSKCQLMHKIQYFKSSLRITEQASVRFLARASSKFPSLAGFKFLENGLVECFRTSVT